MDARSPTRNLDAPDDFYEALIEAHRDLDAGAEPRAQRAPGAAAGQPHRLTSTCCARRSTRRAPANVDVAPDERTMTNSATQTGFGNQFATEAVARRAAASAATARSARRTACMPSCCRGTRLHRAARREPAHLALPAPAVGRAPAPTSRSQQRCAGRPASTRGVAGAARPAALASARRCRDEPLDFIDGLRTIAVNGDADAQTGIAAHVVLRQPLDGAARFVERRRRDAARAAAGRARHHHRARRARGRAAARSRCCRAAWRFASSRRRADARLRLRELRRAVPPAGAGADRLQRAGQSARLPGAGRGLRGRRRPATRSSRKFGGRLWRARAGALAVRRRRLARQPRAAEVRHGALHDDRLDQLRPSRPVDLHRATSPSRHAGHGQLRLRHLPAALAGRPRTRSARPGTTAT